MHWSFHTSLYKYDPSMLDIVQVSPETYPLHQQAQTTSTANMNDHVLVPFLEWAVPMPIIIKLNNVSAFWPPSVSRTLHTLMKIYGAEKYSKPKIYIGKILSPKKNLYIFSGTP